MTYQIKYKYYQYLFQTKNEIIAQHAFSLTENKKFINLFYKPVIRESIKILTENGYNITDLFDIKIHRLLDIVYIKKKINFDYNDILSGFKINKKELCL